MSMRMEWVLRNQVDLGPKNFEAHPFAYYIYYMTVCAKNHGEKDRSLRGV